jgi:thioredoxin 2
MAARSIITCHRCGKRNGVRPNPTGRPLCTGCHQPLAWSVDADTESFDEETHSSLPVLVDFWATWCGPCRMVAPALESLARRFAGSLKVVRVDIDQAPATAQRFQVMSVPSLVLLRDGKEIDRQVGALPEAALEQWLRSHDIAEQQQQQRAGAPEAA